MWKSTRRTKQRSTVSNPRHRHGELSTRLYIIRPVDCELSRICLRRWPRPNRYQKIGKCMGVPTRMCFHSNWIFCVQFFCEVFCEVGVGGGFEYERGYCEGRYEVNEGKILVNLGQRCLAQNKEGTRHPNRLISLQIC